MQINKADLSVLFSAIFLAVLLIAVLWDMNFFPSDADAYYIPATWRVPVIQYPAQLNDGFDVSYHTWLHGKEAMIMLAFFIQNTLKDYQTLRPFIILFVIAFFFSAILLFAIAKTYWDRRSALACYILYISCLWPYIYLLFPKHQPLGVFFFLLATWLLTVSREKWPLLAYFLSGVFSCTMLYSSTVSFSYLPFYLVALGVEFFLLKNKPYVFLRRVLLLAGGFLATFLYFNAPNIIHNIQQYIAYINASGNKNHLFHNQLVLQQWMPGQTVPVRGNLLWVIKYLLLVMPVLFPCAIACFAYLLTLSYKKQSLRARISLVGAVLLSLAPVLMAEIKGVSQYGANYFPAFIGIIFILGFSFHDLWKNVYPRLPFSCKRSFVMAAGILFIFNIGVNAYFLMTDIFPSRLATTLISRTFQKMHIQNIYAHVRYPLQTYILQHLNPSALKTVKIVPVTSISQAKQGYVLLLPTTTRSILSAYGTYRDFDKDIYLNTIVRKGTLDKYSVRTFKTVTSSKFWAQEEEILSWMYLTKGLISDHDLEKGYIRLLSAEKIQQDLRDIQPSTEYIAAVLKDIRFLGKKESLYAYNGNYIKPENLQKIDQIRKRIVKVGDPKDGLIAYVYRKTPAPVETMFNAFVPYAQTFSNPVAASLVPDAPSGGMVTFRFDPPIIMEPPFYYFIGICRTGPLSDNDFYQVLLDVESLRSEDAEYVTSLAEALNLDGLKARRRVDKNTAK